MKNNKLCNHCTSNNSPIILTKKCTLQPLYNGEKCPCSYCLTKIICINDHHTCDRYKEFCIKQAQTNMINIPCMTCNDYELCLNYIKDVSIKIPIEYTINSRNYSFSECGLEAVNRSVIHVLDICLNEMADNCKEFKWYFPYSRMYLEYSIINKIPRAAIFNNYRNFILSEDIWFERYSIIEVYYIKYITEILTDRYKKADPILNGLMKI